MARKRTVRLLGGVTIALAAGIFAVACVPGSGSVEGPKKDGQPPPGQDGPLLSLLDGSGQPPSQDGPKLTPDLYVPPPKLDSGGDKSAPPTGPTPPFGSSVGLTAANYGPQPDCSGAQQDLHGYYNKYAGVVLLLNKGS